MKTCPICSKPHCSEYACIVWLYHVRSYTVVPEKAMNLEPLFEDIQITFFMLSWHGSLKKASGVVGDVYVSSIPWLNYFACIPSLGCIWAASWATPLQRSIIRAWLVRFPCNSSLVNAVSKEGLLGELMHFSMTERVNTGQEIYDIKLSPMNVGGKIGKIFLLAKLSSYMIIILILK